MLLTLAMAAFKALTVEALVTLITLDLTFAVWQLAQ